MQFDVHPSEPPGEAQGCQGGKRPDDARNQRRCNALREIKGIPSRFPPCPFWKNRRNYLLSNRLWVWRVGSATVLAV